MSEPECRGNCYSLTESGGGYVDPDCPKHGQPDTTLVDTGNFFVRVPKADREEP